MCTVVLQKRLQVLENSRYMTIHADEWDIELLMRMTFCRTSLWDGSCVLRQRLYN